MSKEFSMGSKYQQWRTGAYECELDAFRNPVSKGNYVLGRYGMFTTEKVKKEIMCKLSEYADQGKNYPFLITTYRLEKKAKVTVPEKPAKEIAPKDVTKFPRQKVPVTEEWLAVVYSSTDYKFLSGK